MDNENNFSEMRIQNILNVGELTLASNTEDLEQLTQRIDELLQKKSIKRYLKISDERKLIKNLTGIG